MQLIDLNIDLDNIKTEKFKNYIKFFSEYNEKINLISKNDINLIFQKHIFDSLSINLFFEKYLKKNTKLNIIDIGTGGGFPSVPLAINYPEFKITAIDSINKKINFLKLVKEEFDLQNFYPQSCRIENLPANMRRNFDIATARALAELKILLEYSIPYVKTGGYFIAYKSKKADEELKNAQNALKILNTKLIDKIEYKLPLSEENNRVLLVFKKMKNTDNKYPRTNNLIKNSPL